MLYEVFLFFWKYQIGFLIGLLILPLPVFAQAPASKAIASSNEASAQDEPQEDQETVEVKAEEETETTEAATAEQKPTPEKKTGIAKLLAKFKKKDGTPANIGVLQPFDYTTLDYGNFALTTVLEAISRYGDFNLREVKTPITALTLDEFRRIAVKDKLEVIVVVVLKPTNFDIFVYDRRTPYEIYAHSETLPEEVQYRLNNQVVEEFSRVAVRKVLYAYMQDEAFELPRETAETAIGSEIPRWIASSRNLAMLNREILSKFYASVSVGAALTKGETGLWNSNLVGLQVGLRLVGDLYAEGAVDMFSYNAFSLGVRYIFQNKDNPFRMSVGIAGALSTNAYTLNWDQNYTQGLGSQYIVPSVAIMLPIVEVHFKVEAKFFIGIDQPRFIVGLMPGLFVLF